MRRGHSIDVSVEHKSEIVEYSAKPIQPWISGVVPLARGPVQLVIDMPARSARQVGLAFLAAALLFSVAAIELTLFQLVPLPESSRMPADPIVIALVAAVLAFVVTLWTSGVGARREVLEIDSRFVSVRRTRESVSLLPRGCCIEAKVSDVPRSGPPAWFAKHFHDVPWILLGNGDYYWITAGSGISRQSAERIVETISDFMAENPPEQGFDEPGGVLHLYYPEGTASAVRPTSAST